MFSLSGTLFGHEQDVKAIKSIDSNTIVSCLRDSTVRIWSKANSSDPWSAAAGSGLIIYHGENNQFINSLGYLSDEKLVANGGIDGIINLTEEQPTSTPAKVLLGHSKNVCSINYSAQSRQLISSSWDCTAIVWDVATASRKYVLKGHQASVWDAIILGGDSSFLTASADGTIRLWEGDREVGQLQGGHRDVIRKLLLLPGGTTVASASNDGVICIWDLQTMSLLNRLVGHESFIYDLAYNLETNQLVSSGEDRTVRVWLLETNQVVQVITLPCISVWSVSTMANGDIVCGGSDKLIRVFTSSPLRTANEFELKEFQAEVESSAIPEQSMDNLKKSDIPSYEVLATKSGKQEGSTIMVKLATGVIEAHQWSGGKWVKIGDVVGGSGNGSGGKVEYLGEKYDFVFDVDIEEGAPPLKLPFNLVDNPYQVAEKFLADNELPSSYLNDVVNFIMKNTQGTELDQKPYEDPYADSTSRASHPASAAPSAPTLPTTFTVIPQKSPIYFTDFKATIIIKGLSKFNNEVPETHSQFKLSSNEISQVESYISSGVISSANSLLLITSVVPKIMQWPVESSRLIGYDLLRICVRNITTADILQSLEGAEIISQAIKNGLSLPFSEAYIPMFMMIVRILNNLIGTTLFFQLYFTASETGELAYSQDFIDILSQISILTKTISNYYEHKQYGNAILAISTLVYNLSILQITNSGLNKKPSSGQPILAFTIKIGDVLVEANSEAAYRLVVGYLNFKFIGVKQEDPEWLSICRILYTDSVKETRFIELFKDFDKFT